MPEAVVEGTLGLLDFSDIALISDEGMWAGGEIVHESHCSNRPA
jgi:hypothetical protein